VVTRATLAGVKTDKLFYRLFRVQPELLLELMGVPTPYPTGYRQQALELKETGFRLDGLLHPPPGPWPFIFWEAQFQPDPCFYARWLASVFVCLHQQQITRWRGVVVFPSQSVDVAETAPYRSLLEHGPVQRVYLDELTERDHEGWGIALIRLIVAPQERAPAIARHLVAEAECKPSGLTRAQALDLLETVLVYKLPELSREEIRHMLHLPDTDLKKTRFYQEVFSEGKTEGKTEGRLEGESALVWRLLKRRLRNVSRHYEAQIRSLSLAQIETLGEDLLDFQMEEDLAEWLEKHASER
jgi:predicted transposase/invertase (TIGR01784 family)